MHKGESLLLIDVKANYINKNKKLYLKSELHEKKEKCIPATLPTPGTSTADKLIHCAGDPYKAAFNN